MRPNISFIGYRGVGKTTLGKLVADELQLDFFDIDQLIEAEIGASIREYFETHGEASFRKMEQQKLQEVLSECKNSIIAHGGGVVLNNKNRFILKSYSNVIFLNLDEQAIFTRINNGERPSLTTLSLKEEISSTLKKRMPLYLQCADKTVNLRDVPVSTNLQFVLEAINSISPKTQMKKIHHSSSQLNSYDIIIQPGLFTKIPKGLDFGNKYVIITDSNIEYLYATDLRVSLETAGKECKIISFNAGEEHKTLDTFADIHDRIGTFLDRKSCVIALGGGVTGDLAGFVASTYMRGIRFVQIPTSLLAMVDSSIGGKLGVNSKIQKNRIGVFNNPTKVYIDPFLLQTLPSAYLQDGLAEAIKHAIISNGDYFDFLLKNKDDIFSLNSKVLTGLIYKSLAIKSSVVRKDERETDYRRILNFGHTIGHALEEICGYGSTSHGFCVAIGAIAAAFISMSRGLISMEEFNSIKEIYQFFGLPSSLQDLSVRVDPEEVYTFLHYDKKNISGKITFVLLKAIGHPILVNGISRQEVIEAINYVS